jgi:hypothetical protein
MMPNFDWAFKWQNEGGGIFLAKKNNSKKRAKLLISKR